MVESGSPSTPAIVPTGVAALALLLAVICLFVPWGSVDLTVDFGGGGGTVSEDGNLFTYDDASWSSHTDIDDSANLLFVAGIVTAVGVLELAAAVALAAIPAAQAKVPGTVRAFLFLGASVLLTAGLVMHIVGAVQFAGSPAFNGAGGGLSTEGAWTPGVGVFMMGIAALGTIAAAVLTFRQASTAGPSTARTAG